MKEVTVHDFPRRRNQIDFAVVESPWGPLVNPPEEELWFLQSDTATIRIHNLTREAARVVLPAEVAREVVSPEPEFEPDGLAFFSLPGRGVLELALRLPPVSEFPLEVNLESGFRARAGSDPRVRIRS